MKIRDLDIIPVDGGWDEWCFLKVETECGRTGWSEINQERGRRGVAVLVRDLLPLIRGKDPRAFEKVTTDLFQFCQSTEGGLRAMAIGAIQNACLDLAASDAGLPVYALFGGPVRTRLPLYWSHFGLYRARHQKLFDDVIKSPSVRSVEDFRTVAAQIPALGFSATKTNPIDFGVPAGEKPGVLRGEGTGKNMTRRILDSARAQVEAILEGAGAPIDLMVDVTYNFSPAASVALGRGLSEYGLRWLEIDCNDPDILAEIRRGIDMPLASLENVLGSAAMGRFLRAGAADVAIIDPVYNGVWEAVKMATVCDTMGVNVAVHNSHGPLGAFICAQFAASVRNLDVMEMDVDEAPWRQELMSRRFSIDNGTFMVDSAPGWGAVPREEQLQAHVRQATHAATH